MKLSLCASASLLTIAALTVVPRALANPQGGEVTAGQATITTPSATQTQINQQSDKAIIEWQKFNIDSNESTTFVQPNSNSITLNRIFDNDPSVIAGLLSANGKLVLINRNGMIFDSGATVNTAGLIATTADIGNDDFMAGRLNFDIAGNPNAQISNAGLITADEGGVVAFVAPSVKNSGVITAKLGRVSLGAGNTFVLDLYGDNLISFPVSAEIAQQLVGPDGKPIANLIDVAGKIEAGAVQLTARAARGIIDSVINIDGEIIASGIKLSGDAVQLTGLGGSSGGSSGPAADVAALSGTSGGGSGVYGTYGGAIVIDGGAGNVTIGGTVNASGGRGGSVAISGENVFGNGAIMANGANGAGGSVSIAANNFASLTGTVSADGLSGGSINVASARNLLTAGTVSANGASGAGGSISLTAADHHIATSATQVSANGATAGGSITVSGGTGANALGLFSSGSYSAASSSGQGGDVTIGGRVINLIDAKVNASGATGGGSIAVGYTGEGAARAINADTVRVSPTSLFNADATQSGDGGSVVFWSNLASDFMGTITARGGSLAGDGGTLEVSSKGEVGFWGLGDASAANGLAGTLSLDPKNIVVSTAGGMLPGYELIDSGTGSTSFGATVAALSNGNTAVTSTGNDTVANNAGAVFLFNTTTGALISMTTGTRADDAIGSGGITVLSGGNFVIASQNWDNGAGAVDAGAVTFINGTTGLAGQVSAANSIVGGAANMNVGGGGVTLLANGNYVIASPNWDNGGTQNVGAVTWANGANGQLSGGGFGAVSAANSMIGSNTTDNVGSGGVVALSNGNYVVRSMLWNNGATADVGAVTWGNGANGQFSTAVFGAVSAANSLVGSTASDQIGSNGVTALNNGNYVVASSLWNNGANADAGAATWGNGAGGTVGTISAANSFVGTAANNNVGSGGVVGLSNGNFVVVSQNWDNGATTNVGAVTWGSGTGGAGAVGNVAAGNSLIGSQANDNVGSGGVVALTNGNYVVVSTLWNNGGTADVGAVTWRNGAATSSGTVAAANSFVGSNTNDQVGSNGVVALTNGNYVVSSSLWNNGGNADAGAATWGNGTNGQFTGGGFGALGAANSFVGTTANNNVGSGGAVALSNGNFVVVSPNWDNGGTTNVGAVTWGSGTGGAGAVGNVGAGNSLIGTTANDNVGSGGVRALTNGNYVVASPSWTNGGDTDTGAVTWRNGTGAFATTVQTGNSLFGNEDNDNVGSGGIVALANGNYVVSSPLADFPSGGFGTDSDAGAVTLGNGAGGTTGGVSATNSFIGDDDDDEFHYAGTSASGDILIRNSGDGEVFVGLTDPNQLTFARAQGQTLTVNPAFLTNTLNTGTAVTLQASNDITISSAITVNNAGGNGGALTMQAGRSVLINANITTDNGNLTIVANELLANGVINAQRDAGSAAITMASGTSIVAGTGNVTLRLASGAGKTNLTSGDITLRTVSAGTILVENLGTTAGSDVILASGGGATGLSATGAGTPLVVASQIGNFTNQIGAGALAAPNGRWLVYSQTPTADTRGGLAGTPWYGTPYNPANPTGIAAAATGNRFAYTIAPVLSVNAGNQSREYGEPNSTLTFTVTGLIGGDTIGGAVQGAPVLDTTATQSSPVGGGPFPITVTSLGTLSSNYNYGFTIGTGGLLTITPAQLFYLADAKTREYGDPNGLTGTLSGLKNGETVADVTDGTLTFTSLADETSNVGIYAVEGGGLTVTSGNYVLAINQAASNATALNVVPAQLYYEATTIVRSYGDLNGDIDGEIRGLKNGQGVGLVTTGILDWNTVATQTSDKGVYSITGSGLTVANSNYAATILQCTTATCGAGNDNATALTVNAAQLFYRAFGANREYGEANPDFGGEVVGLVLDQTLEDVTDGTLAFTTAAGNTANAGQHAIDGSGLTVVNTNYELTILQEADNATALTITPAQLTYVADFVQREYGDPNVLTGVIDGLKNGETFDLVTSGTLTWTSSATAGSPLGVYEVVGGGLTVTSGNYNLTIEQHVNNTGALEITPAQLFYTANSASKTYGQINPLFTGAVTGLKNGDLLADVTDGSLVWFSNAIDSSDAGLYGIFGGGLIVTSGNYLLDIEQTATNEIAFTINQAQLTYRADKKSRIFGFPDPEFTGEVLGLTNGDSIENATTGILVFTPDAATGTPAGIYGIFGGGLTVASPNYIATILQDPGNATALTIVEIPLSSVQAQREVNGGQSSALDDAEGSTSSRENDLNIEGIDTVAGDLDDGKNDETLGQLCVLGAPEAAASPNCNTRKTGR